MYNKESRVQLNILPAGGGDCIHLRFLPSDGRWRNIVIDSGPAGQKRYFQTLLEQIDAHGENIDLLCFSHIDDDHIKGAELIIRRGRVRPGLITRICMNVPDGAVPEQRIVGDFQQTTVDNAVDLLKYIVDLSIPCKTVTLAGDHMCFDDAELRVVLPNQERLDAYYEGWKRKGYFHPVAVQQDHSEVNGSSIVLLFTLGPHRILLTGDAFSCDLAQVARDYAGDQGFSIVKLPHHGSGANITAEMLRDLRSREFIISTKQTAHRPARETMELLSQYGAGVNGVTVYGNYEWSRFDAGVSNVNIIYPENGPAFTADGIEVYADGTSRQIFDGYQE